MVCIEARELKRSYGASVALAGVDLRVESGSVVGLVGRNGAGKTTMLNSILGLAPFEGELRVLGRDPWTERQRLMCDVAHVPDVAALPGWMRVSQLLDFVAGVHPRFDRARAEAALDEAALPRRDRIRQLSKGQSAYLHLAIVMAIDARLLVLDEPTLGLDAVARKRFYDTLLNDYFDRDRTILVTTHQVEEVQDVLTNIVVMDRGRVVLACGVEELETRYTELRVRDDRAASARALGPVHERRELGRSVLLFDGVDRRRLEALGDVRVPGVADVFVAVVSSESDGARRAAR